MEEDDNQAITVGVRIRPLNKRELDENQQMGWEYNATTILETTMTGKKSYNYDVVMHPDTMNPGMYDKIAKRVVLAAMEGFNGTVFTYGQTGSGKTHSMMGTPSDPGVIRSSVHTVFEYIDKHPDHEFVLRVSYIEVYNEEINDLLAAAGEGLNLRIMKDDPQKGAVIENLIEELVASPQQLIDVVARGESNRHYACTNMNATSSRSHTIYRLIIESKPPPEKIEGEERLAAEDDGGGFVSLGGGNAKESKTTRVSYLNLVDLAGR